MIGYAWLNTRELEGPASNDDILRILRLDNDWPTGDDVPWCSAFMNFVALAACVERSKSLRARSWLRVGTPTDEPAPGWDAVILQRGRGAQPGPNVIDAPGHVGLFVGFGTGQKTVQILGGNQSNEVNITGYSAAKVLGYRRLRRV